MIQRGMCSIYQVMTSLWPNGITSYLVPVDATSYYIANNGYDLNLFYNILEKLPVNKVTVVIDTCSSGDSELDLLFKISARPYSKTPNQCVQSKTRLFLPAPRRDRYPPGILQNATPPPAIFFKGMGGKADGNRDKQITVAEMDKYLGKEVRYYAQCIQPQIDPVGGGQRQRSTG